MSNRAASCNHTEAKLDPVIRAETTYRIGEQHIPEVRCHLLLVNCAGCHSTLSVPLAGHEDADDDFDDTAVLTPEERETIPRAPKPEPVESRAGFVGAA